MAATIDRNSPRSTIATASTQSQKNVILCELKIAI
jgi:hypothetical protein